MLFLSVVVVEYNGRQLQGSSGRQMEVLGEIGIYLPSVPEYTEFLHVLRRVKAFVLVLPEFLS